MDELDLQRLTARAQRTSPRALGRRMLAAFVVGLTLELAGAGWGAAVVFAAIVACALVVHVRRELAAGRLLALEHARTVDGRARRTPRPDVNPG